MTRSNRNRLWRRRMQVFGAALGLSSGSAYANGVSINPGLLASWTFGERGGFGLGTEVSVMYYPPHRSEGRADPTLVNYGAFLQAEKLWGDGRTFRGALGVQAAPRNLPFAGGELGVAVQKGASGWGGHLHGAAFASAAVVGLAFRGTFSGPGSDGMVQPALVFTLKAPLPLGCFQPFCVVGRALRDGEGGICLPGVVSKGKAALHVAGSLEKVSATEQEALAQEWLFAARGEFASVPAFLQLAEDLDNAGAPGRLIEAALSAAEDEVRHARASFALASAYAERPLGPEPRALFAMSSRRHRERGSELARLAVESWVDGVVGEGRAAARARGAAETATDAVVATLQRTIAVEEAGHAQLAADIVAWCLAEGGEPVRRALRNARDEVAAGEPSARVRDTVAASPVL